MNLETFLANYSYEINLYNIYHYYNYTYSYYNLLPIGSAFVLLTSLNFNVLLANRYFHIKK